MHTVPGIVTNVAFGKTTVHMGYTLQTVTWTGPQEQVSKFIIRYSNGSGNSSEVHTSGNQTSHELNLPLNGRNVTYTVAIVAENKDEQKGRVSAEKTISYTSKRC